MADVSKVQGPSGSPENANRKDKTSVDADKFKQEMHRKVSKVGEVEPDEKKKRKRQEEEEEEAVQGPTTPPNQVTPFSLEQEKQKISPLEMQKGGPGISPTESAQPTAPFRAPSSEEMQDDSGFLEEEAFMEETATPQASPGQSAPSSPPPQMPQMAGSEEQVPNLPPVQPGPTSQEEQPSGQRPPKRSKKEEGLTAEALEGIKPVRERDTSAFFEQMGKDKPKEKTLEEFAEEEVEMQGAGGAPPPPGLSSAPEEEKAKVEKKEAGDSLQANVPSTSSPDSLGTPTLPPAPENLPPYANLHPQVMELFDRMAGVMTIMHLSGLTETTITLSAPQFASSVFFGTQIIIQEFSTAPKAFNIQLNGTPEAVALFQGNADDLMAAFQAGNYNFRVNRFETGYLSERPLFKRKEKTGEKGQDETGENP